MVEQIQLKALSSYVGGFLTHLVLGAFYLWGNLTIYATSYYRIHGYPDIKTSNMQQIFPFIYVGISSGMFFGIPLSRRFGHKLISFLNMLIYIISLYLASISNFDWFILFMGFLPGFCIGIEYLIPVDNGYYYNPKKKGFISGIILCGLGFGSLVFNPIMQYLINPDGQSPLESNFYDESVANRVPSTLRILATIYAVIGFTGVLMMFQTKNLAIKIEDTEQLIDKITEKELEKWTDIFKSHLLFFLWLILYCGTGLGLLITANYKVYGTTKFHDDSFFAMVGAIAGLANGQKNLIIITKQRLSRFFWAWLLDIFSETIIILLNFLLELALALTIDVVTTTEATYMTWILLIYFQYGAMYTIFPALSTKVHLKCQQVDTQYFGKKIGPYAYNIMFTAIVGSNFTQFLIVKYTVEQITWKHLFYIYGGISLIGICLHLINSYWNYLKTQRPKAKSVN